MRKKHVALAMIGIALGIAAGAMGAHSLEKVLSTRYLAVWETAWRYWIYNMLGIMLISNFIDRSDKQNTLTQSFYKAWGIVNLIWMGASIFTGTLIFVSLNEIIGAPFKIFGAITPIGGTLLIAAWLWGGIQLLRYQKEA